MRVSQLPVVASLILIAPAVIVAFAPQPTKVLPSSTSALQGHRSDYGKAFAGVFAGMTLASQVAYASYSPIPQFQGACVMMLQRCTDWSVSKTAATHYDALYFLASHTDTSRLFFFRRIALGRTRAKCSSIVQRCLVGRWIVLLYYGLFDAVIRRRDQTP